MIDRIRWGVLMLLGTVVATGCGENEVATEHIRSVVSSVSGTGGPGGADSATEVAAAEGAVLPLLALPNGDTLHIRESVVEFYRERGYEPAWTDDDEILPRGLGLLEAIGQANGEGLDRERYHYGTAHEMARLLEEDAVEDRELEYLGNLDLLLTESFARLSDDLRSGTMNAEEAGLDWQIEDRRATDRQLIEAVLAGEDPRTVLASVKPRMPYYNRLTEALGRLRAIERDGGWNAVDEGEALKEGDGDPRVAQLRTRLMSGDDPEESQLAGAGVDDAMLFDADLRAALERFQTRHTLHEDGALGPNTLAALNVPVEERIEAIRLNLDRWRWLPSDLGDTYILVNVAGFELELVDGGRAIESMNVVVGRTANRTPLFQDTLEYVVVNPYWNVPASIAVEEIVPEAMRDPSYLERNNYEVLLGDRPVSGHEVTAEAVESGRLRIRQRPGGQNALGTVKFLFPNDLDIYLHDTPANHLFSQETRAFSHGCIRLERADDMARLVLDRFSDLDPSEYDRLRAADGEQWITLDVKVPVYILYFTAWADEDGTLRFHPDIYERDRTLEPEQQEKLGPVARRPIALSGR